MGYSYVDSKPFERPDGTTDWTNYNEARKKNGELCYKCGAHIMFGGSGGLVQCAECREFSKDEREVTHKRHIRCPHCAQIFNPNDYEMFQCYSEGTQDFKCPSCAKTFCAEVRCEYSFVSPALFTEDNPPEDGD